jgi:MurNAc alpha-1-phosphate uridylyltransferase
MTVPRTAMLLTAGRGTRMAALTAHRPKPLLTLAGHPIINFSLQKLAAAGVTRLVANLHHHGELIREYLAAAWPGEVLFSDETDELLETGGGLARALPLLGEEPFFAVNGDALWFDEGETALRHLARAFQSEQMSALLLLQPRESATSYDRAGDFDLDAQGPIARGTAYVFTGVQVLTPSLFDEVPDGPFSLNLLYDRAIATGRLHGLVHKGRWFEINTAAGLGAAEAAVAEMAS